jgi:hypothetical protein
MSKNDSSGVASLLCIEDGPLLRWSSRREV